jgi:hypothetical protein
LERHAGEAAAQQEAPIMSTRKLFEKGVRAAKLND